MTKTYKLADAMLATAESQDLDVAEIQHIIAGLTKLADVKAAQHSDKAKRIERMKASKSDPLMIDIIRTTNAHLERLGFTDGIDDRSITLAKLNDAMTAKAMGSLQRMTLKDACYACGVI